MNFRRKDFHCGKNLLKSTESTILELESVLSNIPWKPIFSFQQEDKTYLHQAAYNHAIASEILNLENWESQPSLRKSPRLIGDFRKNLVFVEVQFGNSSTLYRDYYKFQFGLANGLLSIAVLIVPEAPQAFFPKRNSPHSVSNMAEFSLADTCLSILPINVPTILYGLKNSN